MATAQVSECLALLLLLLWETFNKPKKAVTMAFVKALVWKCNSMSLEKQLPLWILKNPARWLPTVHSPFRTATWSPWCKHKQQARWKENIPKWLLVASYLFPSIAHKASQSTARCCLLLPSNSISVTEHANLCDHLRWKTRPTYLQKERRHF